MSASPVVRPLQGMMANPKGPRDAGGAPVGRLFLLDGLKALACVLIVWHHLAFYGPMSDVALPLAPRLLSWLYDYGRMAVQVFLVVAGFLVASQLAVLGPAGMGVLPSASALPSPWALVLRRYRRLVLPLLAALSFAVLVTALVRPWLAHPSVPGVPGGAQLLAHALLLQDLLGIEALSAGVWYVAIDLQLYAMAVALVWLCARVRQHWPAVPPDWMVLPVAALTALSLLWWNRVPGLDATGLYFFGAYGLGMLAFWVGGASGPRAQARALAILLALGVAALALDFRARIGLALATALLLVWGMARRGKVCGAADGEVLLPAWRRAVSGLAQMSYSVFLVHFSVSLLVSAGVHRWWPAQPGLNALGMGLSFALSLVAGRLLYLGVERRPAVWRRLCGWLVLLLGAGALVQFPLSG